MRTFRLTRYFSLFSLILLVLSGVLLGTLVRQHEIARMEHAAEDYNISMTQVLSKMLRHDIEELIAYPAENHGAGAVPQRRHGIETLREKAVSLMRGSDIAKVKIYSLQGSTVFSTEAAQIGEDKSGNAGFIAARQGQVVSELVHRNQFSAFEGVRDDVDMIASYVPVVENGRVVAVFEQYQDVTRLIEQIERSLWKIGIIVCTVFGVLYFLLLAVVQRAQSALGAQEAMLEAANRDLDRRVEERTLELQQSEAQLRESEERFRSLTEMSSDFYWESDVGHRFTLRTHSKREAADAVFQQMSFVGLRRWEVPCYAPDEAGWKAHRALLDAHLPFRDFEISRLGANDTRLHVAVSGDPVFNAAGEFTGYRGVGTDISERKHAETELRIAAAAFETQQSMLITNAQKIILRVNRAFTETSGYTVEDVIGQTPKIIQSGQHDRAFYSAMWQSVQTTGFWQGELWGKRKSGESYPKWLVISAVKDVDGVITHYVGAYTDISERKLAEEKIWKLAFFDQLTGLPNRTLLLDRLQQATSARIDTYGAVLFLDLDNFKTLNDTQGHANGDKLLQYVAHRLLESVRHGDTVARLGGDEFVVMLANLDANTVAEAATQVKAIGQKLLTALEQPYPAPIADFHCSASIGVTLFNGLQASIDDLLRHADLAMYQSKNAGGAAITFFDATMESVALEHAQMEVDLRQAIQTQQFELHYQPQVDGGDERIVGAEALIRWNHPLRGMVAPDEFVPHAERTGLILPLGQWVLESACSQLAAWAGRPETANLTLAINVSAQQLQMPDFAQQVMATLQRCGVNPQRLKLELTESMFAGHAEGIVDVMSELKAVGVGFALDDFGTGYSSLAYLSRLPLDQLKIDRSFVADIESGNNNVAICAATISLAHSLKLKVVAEGVETDAQRHFLATVHRCDMLQGYLYSRPLPLDGFEKLIASSKR